MSFVPEKQVFKSSIDVLEIGTGETSVKLGGQSVWPLYAFDGPLVNPPRVGIQISDLGCAGAIAGIQDYYADCADIAAQTIRAAEVPGAEFVCLILEGADPNGADRSVAETVELVKTVAAACPLPLTIAGCGSAEKDAELFEALAEELEGRNVLFLSATEDNYKALGAAVVLAWGQKLAAESAVDINLAKQLNLLLGQIGVPNSALAMNVGCAVAGYGFEYVASTMERVKITALGQNDAALQIPIITPVGTDAWTVKESMAEEADFPEWGSREERGISFEVATAAACLAAGADAVLLRHPESVSTIATLIGLLTEGGE
ncbi:MAG: acetyl-CoA decarbonylase/synthase complex subunit delta [Coriobacteriales bacterium]|jgi:acetyl-CoA decarbonylase/synthase complex subunit delta|nr:acetyl-CoA decarbonylase/synthase complex subunit delta [Coriobacteriales bacterium]